MKCADKYEVTIFKRNLLIYC